MAGVDMFGSSMLDNGPRIEVVSFNGVGRMSFDWKGITGDMDDSGFVYIAEFMAWKPKYGLGVLIRGPFNEQTICDGDFPPQNSIEKLYGLIIW